MPSPDTLVRPWRTATLIASAVAALELILLVGAYLWLTSGRYLFKVLGAIRIQGDGPGGRQERLFGLLPCLLQFFRKVLCIGFSRLCRLRLRFRDCNSRGRVRNALRPSGGTN